MQIEYIRVSKNDSSQVFDLQQDALVGAGIDPERIYRDQASGRKDDRPGLQPASKLFNQETHLSFGNLIGLAAA